ncbi:MAG: FhaA domain-containing protein [Anaerolineae bacterium]
MNEKQIAQFEAQLEQLVEGAFTNLFRKQVTAHDIAMKLTRSMENTLRYVQDDDVRPIAPDSYTIQVHPEVAAKLQQHSPELPSALSQHIVELVAQSSYRLNSQPIVQLVSMSDHDLNEVVVIAVHTTDTHHTTQAMQPIGVGHKKAPVNPQLIINDGERTVILSEPVLNVGRSDDNHIILDDSYCSRHHIQLRLRFGAYTLFDVNSRSGTTVNNVRVTEHQLQSGDVIKIGHTQLVYLVGDDRSTTTQSLEPVTL